MLVKAASVDTVVMTVAPSALAISARQIPLERLSNLEAMCAEHNVRLARLLVRLEPLVDIDAVQEQQRRSKIRPFGVRN